MTRDDPQTARMVDQLRSAQQAGRLSETSVHNITRWLTERAFAEFRPAVLAHIREGQWDVLEDVFWATIPFGTAGRRGQMYPIGCNAINDRTIGETAQALAEYVREIYDGPEPPTCAIAYDTRHRSDQFAKQCAEIMIANGFDVRFFEGHRSTPLLATTVLYKKCACGIMVSASHNPPTDNAVKVFWSTGGQLRDPHDTAITRRLAGVQQIRRNDFSTSVSEERIRYIAEEMDAVYLDAVLGEGFGLSQGPRDLDILYSPLHGVGMTSVLPALRADGFDSIEVYEPHRKPDGCFPNVPDQVANPESPAVFRGMIEYAQSQRFDIILASDPDADRLGCAAPVTLNSQQWRPISGNQIASLLTEYVLRKRAESGNLSVDHYVIKTLVTTDMIRAVADRYGVRTLGDCMTGFKWIGSLVDEFGPDRFVLGAEEAHGYLVGKHCRDKDGAVAAMLLAEFAAAAKKENRSLVEELDQLFRQVGFHEERTIAKQLPGLGGMSRMQSIMQRLRDNPPQSLAGMQLESTRDYLQRKGVAEDAPTGNLIMLFYNLPGTYVAIRPSGTEPKIKFYFFTRMTVEESQDLPGAKEQSHLRMDQMETEFLQFVDSRDD